MSEESPKVGDESGPKKFTSDREEMGYLERLQTENKIGEDVWNREHHWPRLLELRNKREGGPTQAQIDRFNYLSKLQTKGGPEWTLELQEEIKNLYPLLDKRK